MSMAALDPAGAFPQGAAVGANGRTTRSGQRVLITAGLVLTALFLVAPVAVIFAVIWGAFKSLEP